MTAFARRLKRIAELQNAIVDYFPAKHQERFIDYLEEIRQALGSHEALFDEMHETLTELQNDIKASMDEGEPINELRSR